MRLTTDLGGYLKRRKAYFSGVTVSREKRFDCTSEFHAVRFACSRDFGVDAVLRHFSTQIKRPPLLAAFDLRVEVVVNPDRCWHASSSLFRPG